MISYRIIEGRVKDSFEADVMFALKSGWELAGGVAVSKTRLQFEHGFKITYYQALIRRKSLIPKTEVKKVYRRRKTRIEILRNGHWCKYKTCKNIEEAKYEIQKLHIRV